MLSLLLRALVVILLLPALDSNRIGDEEAARVEDSESQEAAGPAVEVEETAPSRPEEGGQEKCSRGG